MQGGGGTRAEEGVLEGRVADRGRVRSSTEGRRGSHQGHSHSALPHGCVYLEWRRPRGQVPDHLGPRGRWHCRERGPGRHRVRARRPCGALLSGVLRRLHVLQAAEHQLVHERPAVHGIRRDESG